MVRYCSTRGAVKGISFEEAVFMGLAKDRGLIVPEEFPKLPANALENWKNLSFQDLAVEIISLFVDEDELPRKDLKELVYKSYSTFREKEVVPTPKVGNYYVMELFHGPTFAFKDIALQFLGNLFEYFLSRPGKHSGKITVLGATSGDTGSSAIAGLRGKKNIDVYILFPYGRVSPIQEKQMTTVLDANVHNVAVEGTFDDCQHIVKESFADADFKKKFSLAAVNSINWARILAQIVYYVYTYFRIVEKTNGKVGETKVSFSVPTGNFGDILAGYYAKKLGVPVGTLVVATNENDILHRFFSTGKYHKAGVVSTVSPSMDICISSNFERYLYDLANCDPVKLNQWMSDFEKTGKLTIEGELLKKAQKEFLSAAVVKSETMALIKKYHTSDGYVYDPHTAVGVGAAEKTLKNSSSPVVIIGTAHPGKFLDAVEEALGSRPDQHPLLAQLVNKPSRVQRISNSAEKVKELISTSSSSCGCCYPCIGAKLLPFPVSESTKKALHNPVYVGIAVSSLALVTASVAVLLSRKKN